MGGDLETRIRHVTAVLGPTNTGKTHLAIERMVGHESGMIGLPLRLLAREVYDKIAAKAGASKVALITGEEKIKPEGARYWVATVEAMPRDIDVDFLAIDEIQLANDPERGHVFTDRLLHARGRSETLLLGAATMREAIADLIPGANFISRPRLSKLSYSGEKKITRLPQRSAIVAFSAAEVYAIAELIRRQRGGAAVVMGSLSPRTRNAQVALYQSGDVDFLVATDAIGMGLNLDVDHIAFSAARKFDGQNHRNLTPAELGQIAGRAGRYMNDGSFGVTGGADPFDADMIERLETHSFDGVRVLQWRNRDLDFATLDRLRDSLRETPNAQRLARARMADDVLALEALSADREIQDFAAAPAAVRRLWDVCQVPDYRKISPQNHAELVSGLYKFLMGPGERIPEDWFAKQVALSDRVDGDIDTLSTRLAHIRTWTFVANRADWLADPGHWQERARAIEDSLSDALHELLTQRFVDRRTSALMKGMRDKEELNAEIAEDGAIHVEKHYVGRLKGFRFSPDTQGEGIHGKAARHAAAQVLSRELAMRARRVAAAKPEAFRLDRQGRILWRDEEIARLEAASDPLAPSAVLLADEHLSQMDRDKIQARLDAWIAETVADKLKPLADIARAEDIAGLARGIAFRLVENFGVLRRDAAAGELKSLDQEARAQLRKYGVRFGAFNIYFPALLKPAAADLCLALWRLKNGVQQGANGDAGPEAPRAGLTSVPVDPLAPEPFYRACGYHVCGPRAIRIDMLERLADLIRPLVAWRSDPANPAMGPLGSTGDGGFKATPHMMSILGCSPVELGAVFKTLGFRLERRPVAAAMETGGTALAEPAPPEADGAAGDAASATMPDASSEAPAMAPAAMAPAESSERPPSSAPPAVEAAPAEETPRYEEIWRPRRHADGERRPRREHRRHEEKPAAAAEPAAQDALENGAAAPKPRAEPERAEPERADPERAERSAGRDGERDRRGHNRDRNRDRGREPAGGDRPPRGGTRRDRGRGRESRGPRLVSASPPSKGADPDSPFAALGALRQTLEDRAKNRSS